MSNDEKTFHDDVTGQSPSTEGEVTEKEEDVTKPEPTKGRRRRRTKAGSPAPKTSKATNGSKTGTRRARSPAQPKLPPLRINDAKIERVIRLGDVFSYTHHPAYGRTVEFWSVRLFRPSYRPDGVVRFRTTLIIADCPTEARARDLSKALAQKFAVGYEPNGLTNGQELPMTRTTRKIQGEGPENRQSA